MARPADNSAHLVAIAQARSGADAIYAVREPLWELHAQLAAAGLPEGALILLNWVLRVVRPRLNLADASIASCLTFTGDGETPFEDVSISPDQLKDMLLTQRPSPRAGASEHLGYAIASVRLLRSYLLGHCTDLLFDGVYEQLDLAPQRAPKMKEALICLHVVCTIADHAFTCADTAISKLTGTPWWDQSVRRSRGLPGTTHGTNAERTSEPSSSRASRALDRPQRKRKPSRRYADYLTSSRTSSADAA